MHLASASDRDGESRSEAAYRQLLAFIERDDIEDGQRLPSEAELAERTGLSRTSIREALARLRAEGRAVSRRGSGTYAVRGAPAELVRLSAIDSIGDLIDWHEVRLALESEAASLAAERRSDADIEALAAAQQNLIDKLAFESANHEDAAFHRAIAACAHNAKLADAINSLTAHIFRWSRFTTERGILTPGERREVITIEHGEVIAAIVERDADRARSALRRHLLNGRARVLGAMRR